MATTGFLSPAAAAAAAAAAARAISAPSPSARCGLGIGYLRLSLPLPSRGHRRTASLAAAVPLPCLLSRRDGGLSVSCGAAVVSIEQSEFAAEVLESDLPVLVEFIADWCGPCRLISPLIEWASQEYDGKLKVVKVDHDANPQLIEEYKVYGLPALILFKNGQEVPESRREGAISKIKLKEYLDSLLPSTNVV